MALHNRWHHTHADANYRAEAVASFGRTGVRFLIMPVVGLTAITFSHSEIVIRLAELVVAPVMVLYTLTSMGSMVFMAMEEGRRADELAAAATHVVGSGHVAAAAPQMHNMLTQLAPHDTTAGPRVIVADDCVACMAPALGENHRVLVCGHQPLCEACLVAWLGAQGRRPRCPVCRADIKP